MQVAGKGKRKMGRREVGKGGECDGHFVGCVAWLVSGLFVVNVCFAPELSPLSLERKAELTTLDKQLQVLLFSSIPYP